MPRCPLRLRSAESHHTQLMRATARPDYLERSACTTSHACMVLPRDQGVLGTHEAARGVGDEDAAAVALDHVRHDRLERAYHAQVVDAVDQLPVLEALLQKHACRIAQECWW